MKGLRRKPVSYRSNLLRLNVWKKKLNSSANVRQKESVVKRRKLRNFVSSRKFL